MPAPRHIRPADRPPPRRGWGGRFAIVGVLVVLIAGVLGALAIAANSSDGRAPNGATVGGVAIGNLTRDAAMTKLRDQLGRPAREPVMVEAAGKTFTLTAKTGKFRADYGDAVDAAVASGGEGSFVTRGWHKLTGSSRGTAQAVPVRFSRKAVNAYVDRIAAGVEREPKDATLDLTVTKVSVTKAKQGRKLADPDALRKNIAQVIHDRSAERTLQADVEKVAPEVTKAQLLKKTPTVVTVDKGSTTVRLFEDGKQTKTYGVAIGTPDHPTPEGQFDVQTMQVDPAWNVPQSEWAGSLAGQTIPSGDPRNPLVARWIGFDGAVGFHGTAEGGSIGAAASHGCVRMNPADIIELYKRVKIGTPVLVA